MHPPSPDLIERLAAEYVLGTLRGPARRRFEKWLTGPTAPWHADATQAVRRWEDRLAPLLAGIAPLTPSPEVWASIERRIRNPREAAAAPRERRWRGWAMAASVLVVALGAWWYLGVPQQPARETAVELRDAQRRDALWRVDIDDARQRLRLSAVAPYALDAGRAHELWALRDGEPPVSLGLLPQAGTTERALDPAQRAALRTANNLAVSLEPDGGSPTGAPTGPVRVVMPLRLGG